MFRYSASLLAATPATAASAPNVTVALYFESHCGPCQQFTTTILKQTLELPSIGPVVDLKLVPYGNAKENLDHTFTCQHGPDECVSNTLELCALKSEGEGSMEKLFEPDATWRSWPFILCMEQNHGDSGKAQSCAEQTSMDWAAITTCNASSDMRRAVQSAAKKETDSLQPTHQFVPWVVVDGTPVYDNKDELLSYICDAYKGDPPADCAGVGPAPAPPAPTPTPSPSPTPSPLPPAPQPDPLPTTPPVYPDRFHCDNVTLFTEHFPDGYAFLGTDLWVDYGVHAKYSIGGQWPEPVPSPGCAGCRSVYYYSQDGHSIQAVTANYANGTVASCSAGPVPSSISKPDLEGAIFNGSYMLRGKAVDHWLHNDLSESFWTQSCDSSKCGKQVLMREVLLGGGILEYFSPIDDSVLPEDFPELPEACGASPAPTPTPTPSPGPSDSCKVAKERDCPGLSSEECESCMADFFKDRLATICATRADLEAACSSAFLV